MTKTEYLLQYVNVNKQIDLILDEIDRLRSLAKRITPNYSAMPNIRSTSDKIQTSVEQIVELEKHLSQAVANMVKLRLEIEETIEKVNDTRLQLLLKYRYIDNLTWATL